MENYTITQYGQLDDKQKLEAVKIFIDGFGHMMNFTKDKNLMEVLFLEALNPLYFFAYVENETVLGIIGIGTNKIRPIKFKEGLCQNLFGKVKGKILCRQMNAIFQSKSVTDDTDLYIDVLATSKQARCKGIGTKLIQYSFQIPDYKTYYIEVLSKNTNAKRLYEKIGFEEYKKSKFSIASIMGFGYPIKMKKVVK